MCLRPLPSKSLFAQGIDRPLHNNQPLVDRYRQGYVRVQQGQREPKGPDIPKLTAQLSRTYISSRFYIRVSESGDIKWSD